MLVGFGSTRSRDDPSGAEIMQNGPRPVVAVVDDDDDVRESLRFLLETAGYDVAAYDSAQAYLDHLNDQVAACLVLDQHMPQITGVELLIQLQQRGADLPTALITGSPSSDLVRRAKALGVAQILEKPLADDALLRFVQCVTSGT
jgi:two-component system response regulator FixJ